MTWISELKQDLKRYPGRGDDGGLAVLRAYIQHVGFRVCVMYRIANALHRKNWTLLAQLVHNRMLVKTGADIQPSAVIGPGLLILHPAGIVVGVRARVGRDCTMLQGVTLGETLRPGDSSYPVIGDSVMIGAHAVLLGKLTVGDHAKIGANAVVLGDVATGCVAAGVPARVLRASELE